MAAHPPEPHADLGRLRDLIGTWSGEGRGDYPTIEPFRYRETVTFGHAGKPFLVYQQKTTHPDSGAPMHTETGYLRPASDGHVELVLAQPTGLAEIHLGGWEGDALELHSVEVARTPTAKDVRSVRRRVVVAGDVLRYDLWMAHADVPETHHLHAELTRR